MATKADFFLVDDAATARFGENLAKLLRLGDLVTLSGDLSSGKTALARAVIRTLMNDRGLDVPSPSFSLVQPYSAGTTTMLHADLYRLTTAGDIAELGLFESADTIVLLEWPERAP